MKTLLALLAVALTAVLPAADLTLAEIRAQLDAAHPVLTERVNGQTVTLSAEQRAAVLDRWAADRFAVQTPPVPVSVTKRQLRLELLSRGLLAQVVPAIQAALDGDAETAALIEWEDASVFERAHPLVAAIGQALGQSPAQMDAIWRAAALR